MAADALIEEVAQNLEEAAEATRRIDTRSVGFFLGGVGIGVVVGFVVGYRWNKEKIKAEAFKQSEIEVAKIREVYQQRIVAAQPKPSVDEVIEEKGYSPVEEERPTKPPVPVTPASAPPVVIYDGGKSKDRDWNFPEELSKRSPDHPYIIHQDEFMQDESAYSKTIYTYYAGDDTLVDTDGHPLPHADLVVGQDNLKFGHGTDDIDVVYVRNEKLELEMEICRSAERYDEAVLGLDSDESE
jgi:hypothetical protein